MPAVGLPQTLCSELCNQCAAVAVESTSCAAGCKYFSRVRAPCLASLCLAPLFFSRAVVRPPVRQRKESSRCTGLEVRLGFLFPEGFAVTDLPSHALESITGCTYAPQHIKIEPHAHAHTANFRVTHCFSFFSLERRTPPNMQLTSISGILSSVHEGVISEHAARRESRTPGRLSQGLQAVYPAAFWTPWNNFDSGDEPRWAARSSAGDPLWSQSLGRGASTAPKKKKSVLNTSLTYRCCHWRAAPCAAGCAAKLCSQLCRQQCSLGPEVEGCREKYFDSLLEKYIIITRNPRASGALKVSSLSFLRCSSSATCTRPAGCSARFGAEYSASEPFGGFEGTAEGNETLPRIGFRTSMRKPVVKIYRQSAREKRDPEKKKGEREPER